VAQERGNAIVSFLPGQVLQDVAERGDLAGEPGGVNTGV
jgi:hypothetical protein